MPFKKPLLIMACLLSSSAIAAQPQATGFEDATKSQELADLGIKLADANGDSLLADSLNAVASESAGVAKSFLEKYFPTVEVQLGIGDPSKPTAGVLVLSPLSDPSDVKNTIFTQGSIYHYDKRTTLNLGLGYRRLELDNKLLLGVNGFYDHEFPYDHGRTSIGLEARTTVGEVNFNQYWGVSKWKDGASDYEERAMGGTDLEVGVPLPYMNWAKVYARWFIWDGVSGVDHIKGNDLSVRAQVPVIPGLAIEAGHRTYNTLKDQDFLKVTYNVMEFNSKKPRQPWFSETAYQLASMEDRRYEKVRRENIIVKARRATGGVVIARGD